MPVLQAVKKAFDEMGFSPELEPLNHRYLRSITIIIPCLIFAWKSLVYEISNAQEYMESLYVVSIGTATLLAYVSTVLITKKLYFFLDAIDEIFKKGKQRAFQINLELVHCILNFGKQIRM